MPSSIFVNLPVRDLKKSQEFFGSLGYTFNAQFTNDDAASMVINESIYAMLITEPLFQTFIRSDSTICDTSKSSEAIMALSLDSRQAVDDMVGKAIKAGGKPWRDPQELGFMYSHGFEDLDGHLWEFFWMDPGYVLPS